MRDVVDIQAVEKSEIDGFVVIKIDKGAGIYSEIDSIVLGGNTCVVCLDENLWALRHHAVDDAHPGFKSCVSAAPPIKRNGIQKSSLPCFLPTKSHEHYRCAISERVERGTMSEPEIVACENTFKELEETLRIQNFKQRQVEEKLVNDRIDTENRLEHLKIMQSELCMEAQENHAKAKQELLEIRLAYKEKVRSLREQMKMEAESYRLQIEKNTAEMQLCRHKLDHIARATKKAEKSKVALEQREMAKNKVGNVLCTVFVRVCVAW